MLEQLALSEKPTCILTWKSTDFINNIMPRSHDDRFPIPLWETWFCASLGVTIPVGATGLVTGAPQSDGDLSNTVRIKIRHHRQLYADRTDPVVFLSVSVST
jgi:hypothetical protein